MSQRKRNVAFTRPEDPSFLKRIKEQIGYKEGPNIDTKRQEINDQFEDDEDAPSFVESEEEKPQVVVLNQGDLTETEAEIEQKKIDQEEAIKPADLTEKIIFKPRVKNSDKAGNSSKERSSNKERNKKKKKDEKSSKSKLSFAGDEEEED